MVSKLLRIVLLAAVLWVGARPVGPVPALGPLLDPAGGIWAVARDADLPHQWEARIPALGATTRVLYDVRGVPHIFAATTLDAYRALGYVVARDRLFQLEIQTRATAGRLTELVGPRALPLDRQQRQLGLAWSADREFSALDSTSPDARAMAAYADGVNARIAELKPADVPFEYRVLGARPMPWKPVYSLYLLKRMSYTLAFNDDELVRRQVGLLVGDSAAAALFPRDNPVQEPIVPNGRRAPRFDYRRVPPPVSPLASPHGGRGGRGARSGGGRASAGGTVGAGALAALVELLPPGARRGEDLIGSNNWAVSPKRSATHHALLAGDPHLDLTLPSIWYEVHLIVTGPPALDVYGVTIPGAPAVVIGFNRDVAWSFTNGGADVLDFFSEVLDKPANPTRYHLDGGWRPLQQRIETYRNPRGRVISADTLFVTHRGPLLRLGDLTLSVRWTALDPGGSVAAFSGLAGARSVDEWMRAMEAYRTPIQNGIVADRAGSIAIRAGGSYPIRPRQDGQLIRDGAVSANDWTGYLPLAREPYARDPQQGYLASANQQPVDPQGDKDYLGANWPAPFRALRINELLRADTAVTPGAMARFQTDPGSPRADLFVPAFLAAAKGTGDSAAAAAARLLAQWDRRYTRDNRRAVLFEAAMSALSDRLWDELVDPHDSSQRRIATPSATVILELLQDPKNVWWDDHRTKGVVEDRDQVLVASLVQGLTTARRLHGEPDGDGWRWDHVQTANIRHLLSLGPLSALRLPVQGGPSTLNPSSGSGSNGPSWRMVVELGPEVRARAIYPGGQSGNPVSPRYADRIPQWVAGTLDSLFVPRAAADLPAGAVMSSLTLTRARR
jgi:penicillin amidase